MDQKLPLPPFSLESALEKVQIAEDAWNNQDPVRVSKGYTINSEWRNRNMFLNGREGNRGLPYRKVEKGIGL